MQNQLKLKGIIGLNGLCNLLVTVVIEIVSGMVYVNVCMYIYFICIYILYIYIFFYTYIYFLYTYVNIYRCKNYNTESIHSLIVGPRQFKKIYIKENNDDVCMFMSKVSKATINNVCLTLGSHGDKHHFQIKLFKFCWFPAEQENLRHQIQKGQILFVQSTSLH